MRPISVTVGPLAAASANAVSLSQTPAGAGALTINGALASTTNGVTIAKMDSPRRVLVTTADTTHTFTVTGTTPSGSMISELVGPITTNAYTAQDFATVTSIVINGAATAAVTVGTNGIASTPWVRLDEWADAPVSIMTDVTGTVSYTVQSTSDDPNSNTEPVLPANVTWQSTNDPNGVAATGAIQTNYLFAPTFVRILLNSSGTTGVVTAKVIQYNVASR
jgi:hypothetical protein